MKLKQVWEKMKAQWVTILVASLCTGTVTTGTSVLNDSGINPIANRSSFKKEIDSVKRSVDTLSHGQDSLRHAVHNLDTKVDDIKNAQDKTNNRIDALLIHLKVPKQSYENTGK